MERGRAWSSGTATAALTGVVLTGGATLGAAVAQAAPVAPHAPVPPVCTVAATTYRQPPVEPGATATPRPAVLADATGRCVDAISKDLLVPADVLGYALVRVPAAKPTPKPAPVVTTTAPKPATPKPATPKPATTVPTTPATSTTTTPPAAGGGAGLPAPATPDTAPDTTPGTVPAASGAVPPSSVPSTTTTTVTRPSAVRRSVAAGSVPGGGAPAAPALPPASAAGPAAPLATAPLATAPLATGAPLAAVAPLGAVAPGDATAVPAVEPASYLDPLGAPGIGALPGEPTILQTLGGDTAGVTTSSRVQALGLDALHRGGGAPAVVGVTIMAGLGGLALRHRILQRIRRTESAAGGPAPAPDRTPDRAAAGGRHAR